LIQKYFNLVMFVGCVALLALLIRQVYVWALAPPSSGMPGMWRTAGLSGYYGARKS